MPQAVIGPSNIEEDVKGAATASTDDLLAQMAGDEIERLLNEAEKGAAPPGDPDASHILGAELKATADTAQSELDALFKEVSASQPGTTAAPTTNAIVEDATKVNLPAVDAPIYPVSESATVQPVDLSPTEFMKPVEAAAGAQLQSPERDSATLTERAQALISEADEKAIDATEPASSADALAAEMEADDKLNAEGRKRMAAESAGLPAPDAPVVINENAPVTVDHAEHENQIMSPVREPLLVRILEVINSPLDGLSDGARDLIGKIAIVTAFNAIAVMAYLIIFRRH